MHHIRVVALAVMAQTAACGVLAPSRRDVGTLLARRGAADARRELEAEILANPRDVGARLALAALAERIGRPAEALDELETVEHLGGPIGTRWHDEDRARLGRLLLARGRVRLARGAASAVTDLERARSFGAAARADEQSAAVAARALVELHHVDADVRANGRATFAKLAEQPSADPSWRGARHGATADEHARFGIWLWERGARREAYEQLAAWHAGSSAPRDATIQQHYLRAFGWWTPLWLGETPGPVRDELVGAARCRFPGACDPSSAIDDPEAERALLGSPIGKRTAVPAEAAALAIITLRGALRGGAPWGRALVARVDLAGLRDEHRGFDALPAPLRPVFARLIGATAPGANDAELDHATPGERLVAAATRALDGGTDGAVRAALGPVAATDDGRALLAIVAPISPGRGDAPYERAVVRYVDARARTVATYDGELPDDATLLAIARAFRRDPAIAERLGRDVVASSADGAFAHVVLGAMFDALADPARARIEWQAAVDRSPEPEIVAGLAEAVARTGDGDAALIDATAAAAASGDPAVVWVAVSHALLVGHRTVDSLVAASSAIDLAGPDALPEALDAAIVASRELGRAAQADALAAERARLAPSTIDDHAADDPTDAAAALAELHRFPTASTIARAWVAARWNPRDVELRIALLDAVDRSDPRRAAVIAELVALAGDLDPAHGLDAVLALRARE